MNADTQTKNLHTKTKPQTRHPLTVLKNTCIHTSRSLFFNIFYSLPSAFFGITKLGVATRTVALCVCTFCILFAGNFAIFLEAENNFQQNQTRLQADIERISSDVERVAGSLSESQEQTLELNKQIIELEKNVAETEILLEETRDIVRDINISIQNKETEKRRMEKLLTGILRDVQMADRQGFVQTLVTSKNIADALSNMYQFTQLAEYTSTLREDIARVEAELQQQKTQQEEVETILEETKALQQSRKDSLDILLRQTENNQERYTELLAALNIQGLEKQREIEAAKIQQRDGEKIGQNPIDGDCLVNAETKSIAVPAGYFVRPMEGRITQTFGCVGQQIHDGYDIAGGIGVPVYSAAQGKIVTMRGGCVNGFNPWCNGGLGNYVVLQHDLPSGDTVYTVYAHLTSFENLSEGFAVGQRTLLGYNGCTGNTYPRPCGPHLHFSIISTDYGVNCNRMYGATTSKCYDPGAAPFDIF